MKFSDLPNNSFVLYTYNYTDKLIDTKVGKITNGVVTPVFCSNRHKWTIPANIISLVASLEDSKDNFPEYFI